MVGAIVYSFAGLLRSTKSNLILIDFRKQVVFAYLEITLGVRYCWSIAIHNIGPNLITMTYLLQDYIFFTFTVFFEHKIIVL